MRPLTSPTSSSEDFSVSEEFLGLHYLSATDAQSIVDVIKDDFMRFQLPLEKLWGQCYNACSTTAGTKTGVATRIQELEP